MQSKLLKGFNGKYLINSNGQIFSLFRWNNGVKVMKKVEIKQHLAYPKRDTGKESLIVHLSAPFNKAKKYTVKKLVWDTFYESDVLANTIGYKDGDRTNLSLDNLFQYGENERLLKRVKEYRQKPNNKISAIKREKLKRDNLDDDYIKHRLMKFLNREEKIIERNEISNEMVVQYRKQIINKRNMRLLTS